MDKIYVNGMSFYGYHGVFKEENKLGQRFIVDATFELDLAPAGIHDDLEQTVNYAEIYHLTKEIVEGPPFQLVEAVSEKLAQTYLQSFPLVHSCRVKMIKPDPPIPGHYDSVAVEVVRERG